MENLEVKCCSGPKSQEEPSCPMREYSQSKNLALGPGDSRQDWEPSNSWDGPMNLAQLWLDGCGLSQVPTTITDLIELACTI